MCDCGTNKQPRGAALIIAMLVMAVLLLAGTTFLTISSTENQIALNERVSVQAFLLAEAGLHKAIAQLNASSSYSEETNTSLGSGSFTTTVTTAAGCTATSARDVTVTGSVPVAGGQAQVQVRAVLDQISYPFAWGGFAADKDLKIDNNGLVDSFDSSLGPYNTTTNKGTSGNIGANDDVKLDSGVEVWGNVAAGDNIDAGSATVHGSQTPDAPIQSFPSITPSTTPTGEMNVGNDQTITLPTGDTANCNATTRTCYYTKITFGNNSTLATSSGGPVTIYVTGKVELGNNVTLGAHPGTQLQIITKSDGLDGDPKEFDAGNNFVLYGSLYGKHTNIELGNDAVIYGSMIGRKIETDNNTEIHYDQAMVNQKVCTNGKFNIVRGTWREVIP